MTNKFLLPLIISLSLLLSANAGALELQQGVLHYKWGESAANHPGLLNVGTKGDVRYYTKPGETFTIGDATVERIIYGFYNDQLFGVYLNIDAIPVYDKLFGHMKLTFGLPETKTNTDNLLVYKWKQDDIRIKLKMDEAQQKMKLAFYSQQFSSKIKSTQWEDVDTSTFRFVPIEKDKKPEKFVLFEW